MPKSVKNLIIASIVLASVITANSFVYASWVNPTQSPPGGNMPAPINVGIGTQTKQGNFFIYRGNNSEKFGIGSADSSEAFSVDYAGISGLSNLYVDGSGSFTSPVSSPSVPSQNAHLANKAYVDSVVNNIMFWDGSLSGNIYNRNTGNVGIGTNNPLTKLDVQGDINAYSALGAGIHKVIHPLDALTDGGQNTGNQGNYYEVDEDVHIGLVKIYSSGSGTVTFQLRKGHSASGTLVKSKDFSVIVGWNEIYLDFLFTAEQKNWTIFRSAGPGLFRRNSGVSYPYNFGSIRIVGSTAGSAYYYYFFYTHAAGSNVNGNVGIGTSEPSAKIDIDGGTGIVADVSGGRISGLGNAIDNLDALPKGQADSLYAPISSALPLGTSGQTLRHDGSSWIANSAIYNNGSYIGIGTTNPKGLLQIDDNISDPLKLRIHTELLTTDALAGLGFGVDTGNQYMKSAIAHQRKGSNGRGDLVFMVDGNLDDANVEIGDEKMRITHVGNVGIGRVDPQKNLHIFRGGGESAVRLDTGGGNQWDISIPILSSDLRFNDGIGDRVTIKSGGRVGIGTTNPFSQLYISNDQNNSTAAFIVNNHNHASAYSAFIASTYNESVVGIYALPPASGILPYFNKGALYSNNNSGLVIDQQKNFPIDFWTNSTHRLTITGTGTVGIGTTNPASKLSVSGGDIQAETGQGRFKGWYNAGSGLAAEIGVSGAEGYLIAYNRTTSSYSPVNLVAGNTALRLPVSGMTTLTNGLSITSGNVGIGTTDPGSFKLNVIGNARVSGTLEVGGADVAEEFSTDQDYPAGTVLIMGDNGYRSAKACLGEYDTKVLGVVSDNASLIMGKIESGEKAVVALIGVVKVKVNNSGGAIAKGDLLTTSNLKGEAMRAFEPKIGTIIGKALEDFNGRRGEIMVLVNLQ